MEEIWKDIKNYEGLYQISNFGNVKSFDRYVIDIYKTQFIKGKNIKPFNNGNGYMVVSLAKNGKRKNKYIHRLVAEAFLKNYNNNLTINHKDFNRKNNKYDNLEVVTQKENIMYSFKKGRYNEAWKQNATNRKENAIKKVNDNSKEILKLFDNGKGIDFISRKLHLKYDNVANYIKTKRKTIIECIETREQFNNIKEANEKYNVTTIGDVLNGRQKIAAGYHWVKYIKKL